MNAREAELVAKSGLTPDTLKARVAECKRLPVLLMADRLLYHYAKEVARQAFGDEFRKVVSPCLSGSMGKWGWRLME